MPIPAGVATVTVTGAPSGGGLASTGRIDFIPSAAVLYVGPKAIILPAAYEASLAAGVISVVLPAGDDVAGNPTGWTYHVVERCEGGASYDISLLAVNGPTQDLSSLRPVASNLGTAVVVGPAGPIALTESPSGSGLFVALLSENPPGSGLYQIAA